MSADKPIQIHATGEATGLILAPGTNGKPITVIGTAAIRGAVDAKCIEQAFKSRGTPGATDLVLDLDAHAGCGAPVGCVLVSPTHVYPGSVGVDIKCSMSLLQGKKGRPTDVGTVSVLQATSSAHLQTEFSLSDFAALRR